MAQGRSEQFLWYGPNSKMAPLKKKNLNFGEKKKLRPSNFFSDFGAEMHPRPLKCALFKGGGCKRWYFGQICAPVTAPLRAVAPQAPPPPCYGPAMASWLQSRISQ